MPSWSTASSLYERWNAPKSASRFSVKFNPSATSESSAVRPRRFAGCPLSRCNTDALRSPWPTAGEATKASTQLAVKKRLPIARCTAYVQFNVVCGLPKYAGEVEPSQMGTTRVSVFRSLHLSMCISKGAVPPVPIYELIVFSRTWVHCKTLLRRGALQCCRHPATRPQPGGNRAATSH